MIESKSGVLNLNKPSGILSREAVDRVEERYPGAKVGHGGTLDRAAEGVLPILFNEATKLVPYLQEQPKIYHVRCRFDRRSDTLDTDGDVEALSVDHVPSREELVECLGSFEGEIEQVPPRYSALKKDGDRLSDRVERGEDVNPESRRVECYGITCRDYSFPKLEFDVICGKGFYVRALVRDIGEALALDGGVVTGLTRTCYGPFDISEAVDLSSADWTTGWFPPVAVLTDWLKIDCDEEELLALREGRRIPRTDQAHDRTAALDEAGRLRAILSAVDEHGLPKWQPERVLNREATSAKG